MTTERLPDRERRYEHDGELHPLFIDVIESERRLNAILAPHLLEEGFANIAQKFTSSADNLRLIGTGITVTSENFVNNRNGFSTPSSGEAEVVQGLFEGFHYRVIRQDTQSFGLMYILVSEPHSVTQRSLTSVGGRVVSAAPLSYSEVMLNTQRVASELPYLQNKMDTLLSKDKNKYLHESFRIVDDILAEAPVLDAHTLRSVAPGLRNIFSDQRVIESQEVEDILLDTLAARLQLPAMRSILANRHIRQQSGSQLHHPSLPTIAVDGLYDFKDTYVMPIAYGRYHDRDIAFASIEKPEGAKTSKTVYIPWVNVQSYNEQ